jgi:hypothetical protein
MEELMEKDRLPDYQKRLLVEDQYAAVERLHA